MTDPGDTIGDHLARALDDAASHWTLGGFGAAAEFGGAAGEPVTRLGRFGRLTPRGALILDPTDELVMVAYETGFAGGWSHCVALCLPAASAFVPSPAVVTRRGPDAGAARREDRDALLFDLGVGIPQGRAGLRTRDPDLVALKARLAAGGVLDAGSATRRERNVARVVRVQADAMATMRGAGKSIDDTSR